MREKVITSVDHYIDDFLLVRKTRSQECQANLQLMLDACGTRVKPDTIEDLFTSMVILGMEESKSCFYGSKAKPSKKGTFHPP